MNTGLMKRESTATKFIPYGVHISESVTLQKMEITFVFINFLALLLKQ